MLCEVLVAAGNAEQVSEVGQRLLSNLADVGAPPARRARAHLLLVRAAVVSADWPRARDQLHLAEELAASGDIAGDCEVLAARVALGEGQLDDAAALARIALDTAQSRGATSRPARRWRCWANVNASVTSPRPKRPSPPPCVLADQHDLRLWRVRVLHELGTIDLIGGGPLDRLAQARQAALAAGALATAATVSLQMAAWSGNHADPAGALAAGRSLRCRGEPAAAASRCRGGVRPASGGSRSSGSARRDGGGHRQGRHRLRRPSRGPWGRRDHGPGAAVAGPGGPSPGTGRARRGYGAVARHPGHSPRPGAVGPAPCPRPRRWAGRGGRGGGFGSDRVLADPGLGRPRPRRRVGSTGPHGGGRAGLRRRRRRTRPLRLVSPSCPPTGGRGGHSRPVGRPDVLAGRSPRVLRRRPAHRQWPPPADPSSGRPAPRYPAAAGRHQTFPTPCPPPG